MTLPLVSNHSAPDRTAGTSCCSAAGQAGLEISITATFGENNSTNLTQIDKPGEVTAAIWLRLVIRQQAKESASAAGSKTKARLL